MKIKYQFFLAYIHLNFLVSQKKSYNLFKNNMSKNLETAEENIKYFLLNVHLYAIFSKLYVIIFNVEKNSPSLLRVIGKLDESVHVSLHSRAELLLLL